MAVMIERGPQAVKVNSPLRYVMDYLRLNQCGRLLCRAAGLPAWRYHDFIRAIDPATAHRLATIAHEVRGRDYRPAIFVHGVLPRSGTNYLANSLALHPDVAGFPRRLWEFPLLHVVPGAQALQSEFLAMFPRNAEVMRPYELLAYLAGGWLASLQHEAGNRHVLLKSPHVQNLYIFPHLFPRDKLVLCLRDGRDVVASTFATFGNRLLRKSFRQLVTEWKLAAEAVLSFDSGGPHAHPNVVVIRYEDLVQSPGTTVQAMLAQLALDPARYPFDALAGMPVYGSSANTASGEARWQPALRENGFNPIGRWQEWPPWRKRLFARMAGDTLLRAGYT